MFDSLVVTLGGHDKRDNDCEHADAGQNPADKAQVNALNGVFDCQCKHEANGE